MPKTTIAFGEWLPDQPTYANPGLISAKNCVPIIGGYEPVYDMYDHNETAVAGTKEITAFITARYTTDPNAYSYSYLADEDRISILNPTDLGANPISILTKGGTSTYSMTGTIISNSRYATEFAVWGNKILATSFYNPLIQIPIAATGGTIASDTAPRAAHISVIRDFVVLGNLVDNSDSANYVNRIHWSAYNSYEDWALSSMTQCDKADMSYEGGRINAIFGGDEGYVFQENAITKLTYIGSPQVFQVDKLENRGMWYPGMGCQVGTSIFYLGKDNFYEFNGVSRPIGTGKVWDYFMRTYNPDSYVLEQGEGSVIADPQRPIVYFTYPSSYYSEFYTTILAYNYALQKWSGPIQASNIATKLGIHLFPGVQHSYSNIIAFDRSDRRVKCFCNKFLNGPSEFDPFRKGSALTAEFETGDAQLIAGRRAIITNLFPLIDAQPSSASGTTSISIAVSSRDDLRASATYSGTATVNIYNEYNIIQEGKFQRFKVKVANGFTKAQGLEVDVQPGGRY